MFRNMRRSHQLLSQADCVSVLSRGTSGVLALSGDDGYPYAVPMSYLYQEGKLYFHCAREGHKLDAIRKSAKASFCVIDQDQVVPAEFTTYFRSVIAFGTVRILEEPAEIRAAVEALAAKYSPHQANLQKEIESGLPRLYMLELSIQHMTGKEAKELVSAKA